MWVHVRKNAIERERKKPSNLVRHRKIEEEMSRGEAKKDKSGWNQPKIEILQKWASRICLEIRFNLIAYGIE